MEGLMSDAETILGQGSQHQHQQRHLSIEAAGDTGTVQSMEVGTSSDNIVFSGVGFVKLIFAIKKLH